MRSFKHIKIWIMGVVLVCAIVLWNILMVEVEISSRLKKLDVGMTQDQVIDALKEPDRDHVVRYYETSGGQEVRMDDKRHFFYYSPYGWDFILLSHINRDRGIRIVFGEDGRVEQIETRKYLSKYWYVKKNKPTKLRNLEEEGSARKKVGRRVSPHIGRRVSPHIASLNEYQPGTNDY